MLGQVRRFDNPGSQTLNSPMKLLQRPEVWVLLLLAAGATAFVYFTSAPEGPEPLISNTTPAAAEAKVQVKKCTVVRDFGNARLDIAVRMTNKRSTKLLLVAPAVRLLNAKGTEVPPFILPVEPAPELPPQTTADALLRFWTEKSDFDGPLTLEIEGEKIALKSARPMDLEKLKNAEPKLLPPGGDWTP